MSALRVTWQKKWNVLFLFPFDQTHHRDGAWGSKDNRGGTENFMMKCA